MRPLRVCVSCVQFGTTHAPETQLPVASHGLSQPPQWSMSPSTSTHVVPHSMPVMHWHVPLLQVWSAPHVTPAQGSVTMPPWAIMPPAPPATMPPAPPTSPSEPPAPDSAPTPAPAMSDPPTALEPPTLPPVPPAAL